MFSLRNTLLSLSCISAATAHHGYVPPHYVPFNVDCYDYTIPVAITSKNFQWIGPRWTDDYEWIDFLTTASSRPSAGFPPPFGNPIDQTASYSISATFCTPKKGGPKAKTVLLATHGLGFDRRCFAPPTLYPSSVLRL